MDQQGYMVGNLDEIDSRFKCTHCRLVLREPMQGDCGHLYCKNCIFAKFAEAQKGGKTSICDACDPSDSIEISPTHTYPDNAIKREIAKLLQVKCPYSSCTELMLVIALSDHLQVCEFKPQHCNLCHSIVAASQMQEHREKLCLKRLEPCNICKQRIVFDSLEEHKVTACPGITVQCEFCLTRIKDSDDAKTNHWFNECPLGWQDGKSCPYGCTDLTEEGGWREHREKCAAIHIDRLLAKLRLKQLKGSGDGNQPQEVSQPTTGNSEISVIDYDSLVSLTQRVRLMESRSAEMSLPAGALAGEAGNQPQARKYLHDLMKSLEQGDKLSDLLGMIKQQFDNCYEKIQQYETRLQKQLEAKLDIERRNQELVKLLAYKEMKILDLERRSVILEHAGYDGTMTWKITDVSKRKMEAREGKVCSVYSPPFYTSKAGYKMCGRLYLNGDGAGKNTHISLFFVIMRGAFDALLPWPFSKKVSMILWDQNFEEHVIDAFRPDASSSSFKRPITDMNIASGCPLFMPLAEFENSTRGYVKEDTMFIKFIIDKSDLPT